MAAVDDSLFVFAGSTGPPSHMPPRVCAHSRDLHARTRARACLRTPADTRTAQQPHMAWEHQSS
eukprot:375608-Rhodomonas_salina.1